MATKEEQTKNETVGEALIKLQQEHNEHAIERDSAILGTLTEIVEVLKEISLQIGAVGEKTEYPERPKFTPVEYDSLPWTSLTTSKGQLWHRFSTAQDCGAKNPIKNNLIAVCMSPEATIQAPTIVYDYGYWIYRDWLYRRQMKSPVKK